MSRLLLSNTMRIMCIFVLCVCAILARPENSKAENKPEPLLAANPNVIKKRDTADMTLPNISEDVLEKALGDRKFVQRQIKCVMNEGTCDPIGRKIKAYAPLVMRGICVKCTQSEIKQIQRIMLHIQKNYPKEYSKMLKQYQNVS